MEFLTTYNLWGLVIGVATFLIIGLFHPLVVKAEYYFGAGIWWAFLLAGLVFMGLSVMVHHLILSTIFGVIAFSSLRGTYPVSVEAYRIRPPNDHVVGEHLHQPGTRRGVCFCALPYRSKTYQG